ncbi:hypothetical protein Trydic_g2337 [Trypoxylus dichotomus]
MLKIALLLLLVLVFGSSYGFQFLKWKHGLPPIGAPNARARAPVLRTLTQRIDHFNPRDTRTFTMRYYSNDQFYAEGGPIFIMIGGEWEISPSYLMTGLMFDMAVEHSGYLFYTEHRYYGNTHPTADHSSENLSYLSIDQSLADLVYFIEYQKSIIPGGSNSKVVIVGGSYAGTMATWARIKYPHLIDAAWSSSGPLRASSDFYEYFDHIGQEIRRVDEACYNSITEAMDQVMASLATEEGVQQMSELFNTCDTIDTSEPEISYFFSNFANPWAWAIQYAESSATIQSECNWFNSFGGSSLDKMVGYMNYFNGGWCISDLKFYIEYYSSSQITGDAGRAWIYQCCTEFGWLQTGSENQPFAEFSNQFVLEICNQLFSADEYILSVAVNRTNLFYGSVYPEVTRLVSVHGSLDPWMSIGVQSDINEEAPVIIVPDAAHCADLGSISAYDTEEMRAAKTRIMALIREWIS